MTPNVAGRVLFYLLVAAIIVYTVFPFYWAICRRSRRARRCSRSSSGRPIRLRRTTPGCSGAPFARNILNSVVVSVAVVALSLFLAVTASYALGRVRFRGRGTLLMVVLGVSMFPQVAVLSGMFELIRWLGLYNTLLGLILSYMIFTLPFTVWVLTTFMRELPKELEEAAVVDGASPWVIITRVFLPLMGPALATTGLLAFIAAWNEFLFALTFTLTQRQRDGAGRDRADIRDQPVRAALGQHHGGLGHRDRAAAGAGPDLPAEDRLGPHRRRREGLKKPGGIQPWPTVTLRGVRKSFGGMEIIHGVDLDIDDGEFIVFVGPSGCGKSTLLRLIAGLEDITSGEMTIDGVRVNDLPPTERGIAMVFQSYALYPHMTVYDNMAFGLKLAKAEGRDRRAGARRRRRSCRSSPC